MIYVTPSRTPFRLNRAEYRHVTVNLPTPGESGASADTTNNSDNFGHSVPQILASNVLHEHLETPLNSGFRHGQRQDEVDAFLEAGHVGTVDDA